MHMRHLRPHYWNSYGFNAYTMLEVAAKNYDRAKLKGWTLQDEVEEYLNICERVGAWG